MKLFDVGMITTAGDNSQQVEQATIGLEFIRTFYPRHDGPGTRLTFNNGKGFPVSQTFEEIKAAMVAAGIRTVDVNMVDENARAALAQVQDGIDDNDDDGEPIGSVPTPEPSSPGVINPSYLRAFYPRHGGRVGTRLTFADGSGFAITNLYPEFKSGLVVN